MRFIITTSMYGQPPGMQPQILPRGTTIADSVGAALLGDIVYPAICSCANPVNMTAIDGQSSATALAQLVAGQIAGSTGDRAS
jgi:hypothetical protein